MTEREYAVYVSDIIKKEMDSLDVMYGDIIQTLVGMYGFNAMQKYRDVYILRM